MKKLIFIISLLCLLCAAAYASDGYDYYSDGYGYTEDYWFNEETGEYEPYYAGGDEGAFFNNETGEYEEDYYSQPENRESLRQYYENQGLTFSVNDAYHLSCLELRRNGLKFDREKLTMYSAFMDYQTRDKLYEKFKRTSEGAMMLNLLVGWGTGSFRSGYIGAGIFQFVVDAGITALASAGTWWIIESSRDLDHLNYGEMIGGTVSIMTSGVILLFSRVMFAAYVSMDYYNGNNYDSDLKSILYREYGGNSYSMQLYPVINPVDAGFGLALQIKL